MKIYCARTQKADEPFLDSLVGQDCWIKILRTDKGRSAATKDFWYVRILRKEPINKYRTGLGFKFHGASYSVWGIPALDIEHGQIPLNLDDADLGFYTAKYSLESCDIVYPIESYTTAEIFGRDIDEKNVSFI